MKIITWVLVALLLFGLLTAIISPMSSNVPSSESGTSPPYEDELPDDGGDVVDPETPVDPDDGSSEEEETITPTVLISEEQMLFGTTYTSVDESVSLKTLPVYNNATVSDDLKTVTSNYFGQTVADGTTWGQGNYFELTFPHQDSGIYSLEYTINYYGNMPACHNYVKSPSYLNSVYFDLLDVTAEGVVDYTSDIGYTLTYLVSFDFDTNYMSVNIKNEAGEYDFNVYDITLLSADNTGGTLADIQYRSDFRPSAAVDSSFEKIEVVNLKYSYHPEGSSIIPDEVVEDNAGTVVEGETEAYAGADTLSFESGTSYAVGDQTITTDYLLTDYQMTQYESLPVWPYSFTYVGPDSGKYGENSFNIHLPNFESGTYVFTIALDCQGSGSFFYPTELHAYLKTPGLLNSTHMFNVDKTKVSLAKLAGYEFTTGTGGQFTMQYIFDFDNDVINCNLIDLNGKSYSLGEQSLAMYREYYDESSDQTINTKVKPITLRFQIPPDTIEVNPNNTQVQFLAWSYKKLINS